MNLLGQIHSQGGESHLRGLNAITMLLGFSFFFSDKFRQFQIVVYRSQSSTISSIVRDTAKIRVASFYNSTLILRAVQFYCILLRGSIGF